MIKISDYLDPSLVAFLDVGTRDEAIEALIDVIERAGKLRDRSSFHEAIMERERIVSTAVGMGTAIPHAKLSEYQDFFIAIGILRRGIDWNALDGSPVRVIFMIGGPDNKQTEYLQILSGITHSIKNESVRKRMLTITSPELMIELFKSI